ncbi:ABC transporter permease [Rugosimonospora africana]|uniref:Peptide ABC transporter permease n=1 Tax=Rugosimonospora africana TaxID=556532 RepID=A0A8J3QWQ3_9ACTN|nr:ABC transporter permease [Rugosimonospora africana]GIH17492.1 peptide ABC transporter permease [Rugosimonospora africana]
MSVGALDSVTTEAPTAARATWSAFRRNPLGMISLVVLALIVLVAIFAPLVVSEPQGYGGAVLRAPSGSHIFGTDNLGRDIFAEVVWGTRISVLVAAASSALAIVIGVLVAVLGAYFPKADTVIGTIVDLCLSLPVLPLMILVTALAGTSLLTEILIIAFFSWPEVARVVRSQALSAVRLPYMDAARLTGGSSTWIIRKHLLPAVAPVVIVSVALTSSRAVLTAASLAFLGLGGVTNWSWGRILFESEQSGAMSSAWWTTLFPSLAMLVLVVSATLISITYNDARNPRSRED